MKWGVAAGAVTAVGAILLGLLPGSASPVAAAPRAEREIEARLLVHIKVLASDDFDGREPGTEGEAKTLRYLARQ